MAKETFENEAGWGSNEASLGNTSAQVWDASATVGLAAANLFEANATGVVFEVVGFSLTVFGLEWVLSGASVWTGGGKSELKIAELHKTLGDVRGTAVNTTLHGSKTVLKGHGGATAAFFGRLVGLEVTT